MDFLTFYSRRGKLNITVTVVTTDTPRIVNINLKGNIENNNNNKITVNSIFFLQTSNKVHSYGSGDFLTLAFKASPIQISYPNANQVSSRFTFYIIHYVLCVKVGPSRTGGRQARTSTHANSTNTLTRKLCTHVGRQRGERA